MSDGGKGSRPRPFSVSQEEYATRWDAIFARDLQPAPEDEHDIDPDNPDDEPKTS